MPDKDTKKQSAKKVTKKVAKKATAKKPVAKKTTAKKPVAKKATAKKPVAKKATAKKPVVKKAGAKKSSSQGSANVVSQAQRHQMIEVAAYYRSLSRGQQWQSPEGDWLAAEAQVDADLAQRGVALQA